MSNIGLKQYKMLKRISKNKNISYDKLAKEEIEICDFLEKNNFVTKNIKYELKENSPIHLPAPVVDNYSIAQDGEKEIYNFKSTFYKIRISMIMSIISTITAVVSAVISIIAVSKP